MKQWEFTSGESRVLKYRRAPAATASNGTAEYLSYLYIGNNFKHFKQLIKGFDNAYHVENFTTALNYLSQAYSGSLPDVVLFDANQDAKVICDFLEQLQKQFGSGTILAIAEASSCSAKHLATIKHCKLIDDLISIHVPGEALRCKVKFLQRTKWVQHPSLMEGKLQTGSEQNNLLNFLLRRAFELTVCTVLLLILSPILLLIALAIKLESRGPIYYSAPRAGRGYRIFKFYKFRTMVVDADKKVKELSHLNQYAGSGNAPVFFKVTNDPRITRVGAFLRNTSLDELLQLFNILRGDMSFVGNRPLPLYEAEALTTDEYAARFMAPAGITGLWQIKKRGSSNMSVEERINLDIDYAEKSSFIYDLWIIANTPTALLQKANV